MKLEVYNKEGEKSGNLDLPEDIFNVEWNPDLVHQAFVAHRANNRKGTVHVKDRSEVRGGGRKPWRQKGTGRARHGSIRSPLWAGGGTTFGPSKEKDYSKKINKKEKRQALHSLISKKLEEGEIKVLENFDIEERKTKLAKKIVESTLDNDQNALFLASEGKKDFGIAVRNIPGVESMPVKSVNIENLLSYKFIIFEKEAIKDFSKHFSPIASKVIS